MNELEQKFQKKMKDRFFCWEHFLSPMFWFLLLEPKKSLLVALSAFSISPLSILFPKFLRWGAEICPNVRLHKYLLKMFLQPISLIQILCSTTTIICIFPPLIETYVYILFAKWSKTELTFLIVSDSSLSSFPSL